MAEIDRARLIEIATAIRRGARQPLLVELCDGVFALARSKPVVPTEAKPVRVVPTETECRECAKRRAARSASQTRQRARLAKQNGRKVVPNGQTATLR
jgi:hypothetical protein